MKPIDSYRVSLLSYTDDVDPLFLREMKQHWLNTTLSANHLQTKYLKLVDYRYQRQSLTIDPVGRTNEYELIITLEYQFLDDMKQNEATLHRIRTRRFMRFDREQLTVKNREENFLVEEMWKELIQRMQGELLRQI
ncbi:MAG: LPS assembly lipoprotein LptE [Pseudomonadota bacterium]